MNNVIENNIRIFTEEASKYKRDYFRGDEKYIVSHYFRGKNTLVLGCGAGRTLFPIYVRGVDVTGIDITPQMVEEARKKVRERERVKDPQ